MDDKMDQVKEQGRERAEALAAVKTRQNENKLDQLVVQLKEKAAKATEKMRQVLTGKSVSNRPKWRP